jgi:hypothetical protein
MLVFQTLGGKVSIQEMIMLVFLLSQIMIELSNFKNGMLPMEIQVFSPYPDKLAMEMEELISIALLRRWLIVYSKMTRHYQGKAKANTSSSLVMFNVSYMMTRGKCTLWDAQSAKERSDKRGRDYSDVIFATKLFLIQKWGSPTL